MAGEGTRPAETGQRRKACCIAQCARDRRLGGTVVDHYQQAPGPQITVNTCEQAFWVNIDSGNRQACIVESSHLRLEAR